MILWFVDFSVPPIHFPLLIGFLLSFFNLILPYFMINFWKILLVNLHFYLSLNFNLFYHHFPSLLISPANFLLYLIISYDFAHSLLTFKINFCFRSFILHLFLIFFPIFVSFIADSYLKYLMVWCLCFHRFLSSKLFNFDFIFLQKD